MTTHAPSHGNRKGSEEWSAPLLRFARRRIFLLAQVIVVVVVLWSWETASGSPSRGAILDELYLGKPSGVWQKSIIWLADGTIVRNAWATLREAIFGFALGGSVGVSAAVVLGTTNVGRRVLAPLVFVAYALPRLALYPLFLLWFGLGMQSKVAFVALVTFFYMFFNTYEGARQVDGQLIAVCRVMKASRWQILSKVILPSVLVWVTVGLKLSVPHAFTAAVAGEILAGREGLGALIRDSAHGYSPNGLFAATFFTALLAIGANAMVTWVVNRRLSWRTPGTQGAEPT